MLPFGSITSIIPLFILAFAYVIYFSASLLNKHNTEGSNEPVADDKFSISAELSSKETGLYPDFRYLDDHQSIETNLCTQEKVSYKDFTCQFFHELRCGYITPQYRISGFSPRPPPVI